MQAAGQFAAVVPLTNQLVLNAFPRHIFYLVAEFDVTRRFNADADALVSDQFDVATKSTTSSCIGMASSNRLAPPQIQQSRSGVCEAIAHQTN